jgi:hypothetical protein
MCANFFLVIHPQLNTKTHLLYGADAALNTISVAGGRNSRKELYTCWFAESHQQRCCMSPIVLMFAFAPKGFGGRSPASSHRCNEKEKSKAFES